MDPYPTPPRARWPYYLPAAILLALAAIALAWPDASPRDLDFRPTPEAEAIHRRAHEGALVREGRARMAVGAALIALAGVAFGIGVGRARRDAQALDAAGVG